MRTQAIAVLVAGLMVGALQAEQTKNPPLPDIRQLMREVLAHQKELEKVRENYTYSSQQIKQDIDANGRVVKTETEDREDFFVNSHIIERTIKRNGKPLTGHDLDKETERVTKLVEKAQRTPPGEAIEGPSVSVSRVLEIMDVRNPRRELYHGRPTIVFDFAGRRDAKTHGVVEDASKKLKGTIWVDEADRQVAHMDVSFDDNFRVAAGLFASIQKGSNFHFEQGPVSEGLWLPIGGEGSVQARVLVVKNLRQRFVEKDYDYKRFSVDTQQQKDAKVLEPK